MLVMEYGGPLYEVEITKNEGWATNTETKEKLQLIEFKHDNNYEQIFMKFTTGESLIGRRFDNFSIDPKVEESLWDE